MKIPTILKGDDSGSIVLVMDEGHDYTGATLVVAYSGVTRKFTDLTPGGSVSLAFTHEETAGFKLGCKPVLMRLIGPSGAVETVENAEMKIKVTDCLGEVNAGGSFVIKPGAAGVPVTDVGDLSANANVGALYAKVNEIVRVLAQRSLLSLAALLSAAAFATVQTAQLADLDPSSVVVTNVVESAAIDTNAVIDIALTPATNYTDRATGEVVRLVGALADEKRDLTNLVVYAEKYITVTWNDPTLDPPISVYDTFYGGGPYWIETHDQYESFSPQEDQFEGPGWYVNDFGFYSRKSSDHGATSITAYISGIEGFALFTWTAKDRTIVGVEPTTNTLATTSDLAGKADSSELEPLSIGYQRLYSFQTSATNVNLSVTNYPPTAEEAEGRTHFDPTAPDPDLDFSTVPASLRVDETRGGKRTVVDTRDWPFWFFTSKLPGILAAAREYAHEAYTNALVSLAAWASRTATGAENPAGDSTLVVDVPNIWLMTDQTFEKHVAGSNSCWVIRSKNAAVSPGVATNGFLELTDAFGAPYIRFNKTEATFADPPADGISYDADAGEWLISYSTEAQPRGGANVALQGSADYPGKAILKEADDPLCPAVITWSGSARNWVMHARPKQIDGIDPGRMFFGAVVEIEGQDYIEYLKPVSFSHIVLPNGKKIAPDVPQSATVGSTVTWKVVL